MDPGEGTGMNFLHQALAYIFTAANWTGPAGLGMRMLEHLEYLTRERSL